MDIVSVGDIVVVKNRKYNIAKILSQDYWDRFGWDIEFIDDQNKYHHWKQYEDHGELIRKGET